MEEKVTIEVPKNLYDQLKHMAELVVTQDNRGTRAPFYYTLRSPRRVYGMDWGYSDDYVWVCDEIEFHPDDPDIPVELRDVDDDEVDLENDEYSGTFKKVYYTDIEVYHGWFLTEEAAEYHLKRNKHNLPEGTVTYVDYSFRNTDADTLQDLFEFLAGRKRI